MKAKFIQFFDIHPGKEDEFNHFVKNNYIPGIHALSLTKIIGFWHVGAGEGPYCVLESTADSMQDINRLLMNEEFIKLNNLLHFLITNYKTKILASTGQPVKDAPKGVHYRFNHHYNVHPTHRDTYLNFMDNCFIPAMEKLNIKVIGRWQVALGPGPRVVVEGSCSNATQILKAIGTGEYRKLTSKIYTLADTFGSKILVPTGLLNQA